MLQNIDQLPERITDVESADTPGFAYRPVLDGHLGVLKPCQRGIQVIHLDGQVGHRSA